MAQAFDTTVAELENELATLIQDGSIKARIDSHKQASGLVSEYINLFNKLNMELLYLTCFTKIGFSLRDNKTRDNIITVDSLRVFHPIYVTSFLFVFPISYFFMRLPSHP